MISFGMFHISTLKCTTKTAWLTQIKQCAATVGVYVIIGTHFEQTGISFVLKSQDKNDNVQRWDSF